MLQEVDTTTSWGMCCLYIHLQQALPHWRWRQHVLKEQFESKEQWRIENLFYAKNTFLITASVWQNF